MLDITHVKNQIQFVENFQDLIATPFQGDINAMCWTRNLIGDFSEIIQKVELDGFMAILEPEVLMGFSLSEHGKFAREILINDLNMLQGYGADPVLNVIKAYERDDSFPIFPTDVYSFHVDHSAVPFDTYLCTYYGESSDILPNSEAVQKVLVPEIRDELKKLYGGDEIGFEAFLTENFFNLHYDAKPGANPISLGIGNMWKLAIDFPNSQIPPCIHRAPKEKIGEKRLLLIC